MKINEIIMEGPFSWLADKMVGRANTKSGKKDFQKTIGSLMYGWDTYVQRAGLDLKTNPAQYKQFLDMYLKKAVGIESNITAQLASRKDVANYVQAVYQEKAKSDLMPADQQPAAQPQTSQPSTQQPSYQQPAAKSKKYAMPTVINDEPAVIRYNSTDYIITPRGWAMSTNPNKLAGEGLQKWFDQAHDKSLGLQQSVGPTAKASQAPKPAVEHSTEDVINPKYTPGPPPPGFVQVDLRVAGKEPQTRYVHSSQLQSWVDNGWTKGAGDGSVAWTNKSNTGAQQ